jgi:hypothetical protein
MRSQNGDSLARRSGMIARTLPRVGKGLRYISRAPIGAVRRRLDEGCRSGFTHVGGDGSSPRRRILLVEAVGFLTPSKGGIAMKLPQTGGCQCGKVRYEITEAPQFVYTCHCKDCQRLTSSAFSLGMVVPESGFHLRGIEPRPLQRIADSGQTNTRWVCPECGSWVCSPPRDGVARVRASTLDDTPGSSRPGIYGIRSKQPWITLLEGDEIFEAQPPPNRACSRRGAPARYSSHSSRLSSLGRRSSRCPDAVWHWPIHRQAHL